MPGTVELTYNYGTDKEEADQVYHPGNTSGGVKGGFGHIGITVRACACECACLVCVCVCVGVCVAHSAVAFNSRPVTEFSCRLLALRVVWLGYMLGL